MAGCSAIPSSSHHLRSVSMPSKFHPFILRVEEELKRLKTQEIPLLSPNSSATAEMVSNGLDGLQELYCYIEDLLQLPLIQKAIIHHGHNKLVEEELENSIKMLDLCGAAKDLLLALKESVLDLKSALRRRGDSAVGESIAAYILSRKKAQKNINKCLGALKKLDTNCKSCPLHDQGCELSKVFRVLSEARAITAFLFSSTFSFMTMPRKNSRPSKWSLVTKAMQKVKVEDKERLEGEHELEGVDYSLSALCRYISSRKCVDSAMVLKVQKQLAAVEKSIEGVENGLDLVFRRLVQNRVLLLNILSP